MTPKDFIISCLLAQRQNGKLAKPCAEVAGEILETVHQLTSEQFAFVIAAEEILGEEGYFRRAEEARTAFPEVFGDKAGEGEGE